MTTYRLSASRGHRVVRMVLCAVCLSTAFYRTPTVPAAEKPLPPPPSATEVQELIRSKPLNAENWPAWRYFFVRLYYAYDVGVPKEFYDRIGEFFGGLSRQNGGALPAAFADDPVAWIAFAQHLRDLKPLPTDQVIAASRRALAAGDPWAMSSHTLALNLVITDQAQTSAGGGSRAALDEAERLLKSVDQRAPQSRVSYYRGQIALARGDKAAALPLLRQAAFDFPRTSVYAVQYLQLWLQSNSSWPPFAKETAPFVSRFPDDASIAALHAVALYRDERFPEAYAFLVKARERDEKAVQLISPETIKAIEEDRWLSHTALDATNRFKKHKFVEARTDLRQQLKDEPQNLTAARFLAMKLVADLRALRVPPAGSHRRVIDECEKLCAQFPTDPMLQLVRAGALHISGRHIDAMQAIGRAKELGGDPQKYFSPEAIAEIEEMAGDEEARQFAWRGLAAIVLGAASWLALMFLLAVMLAVCIPRRPNPRVTVGALRSPWEIWLERFYLLVLSASLLVFYLTVPVVSLGILTISLLVFVVLFCVRIVHIGVLQRGFYASFGMIRGIFLGRVRDVQGIAVDEKSQPQLIAALREVADKLETSTVDAVFLTPSAQICVYETGSGPFGLFRRRRVMEIGIPAFSQLTQSEFKSVIAHEYGHFTHRDPLYTQFISQVTGTIMHAMAVMNAALGVFTYVNPFHWFFWLYLRAYTLLAAGFSRSREFLADRRAVAAYGKDAFVSGLTKMSVDGGLFANTAVANIRRELSQFLVFVNVFEAFRNYRDRPEFAETRQKMLEEARATRPRWFDTHPTYSERIAAVSLFPDSSAALNARPASELVADLQKIEEQLTQLLTGHVHRLVYPHAAPMVLGKIESSASQSPSPAPPEIANCAIDYENAEAVLAAASALDHRGEWADAIALYTYAAQKWKEEHSAYAENCIRAIEQKRAVAEPSPG